MKGFAVLTILLGSGLLAYGLFLCPVSAGGASAAGPAVSAAVDRPRLVDFGTVEDALSRARIVTFSAYVLSARIERDLEAAADRGAQVSVALTGSGMRYAVEANRRAAGELGAHGIRVHLLAQPIHMKAIVCDGTAVYVSDRNWSSGHSVILGLPSDYRLVVERAILGQTQTRGTFTTRKGDSLTVEGQVFATQGPLLVSTESFDANAAPVGVLVRAAQAGRSVTLIVARTEYEQSARERAQLRALSSLGVHVRLSSDDEKIAVSGRWAWVGSANLSSGVEDQVDWGYATSDPELVEALRRQLLTD